jgi:hypothetical protein
MPNFPLGCPSSPRDLRFTSFAWFRNHMGPETQGVRSHDCIRLMMPRSPRVNPRVTVRPASPRGPDHVNVITIGPDAPICGRRLRNQSVTQSTNQKDAQCHPDLRLHKEHGDQEDTKSAFQEAQPRRVASQFSPSRLGSYKNQGLRTGVVVSRRTVVPCPSK